MVKSNSLSFELRLNKKKGIYILRNMIIIV